MTKRNAYICPKCGWMEKAHQLFGWSTANEHAVEVHETTLCPKK